METDGAGTVDTTPAIPTLNITLCSGCGRCVAACPEKIFTLETYLFHKNAVMRHIEHCNGCGFCVKACPVAALFWEP